MDILEFFRERRRMCAFFNDGCHDCPANTEDYCIAFDKDEEAVPIVEKWSAEHPRKTRQSIFLEQYPETNLDSSGRIMLCPGVISKAYRNSYGWCKNPDDNCSDCCHKFWMQEIE